jgi:iron complex transport system ATP-binding protein
MGYSAKQKIFSLLLMKIHSGKILTLDSLKIGYNSGKNENILLPPLNASADSGELIAVIGRNGIGKSTLLRTLTGLQRPLGGEIRYDGKNIIDYSRTELAHMVGYISTEIIRVSNMSVYDLVSLGRFPHTNWMGKIGIKDHEVISSALEKTSMEQFGTKFISELSDGERQKAMIARILAQDTRIMVMDEPTAFLDVASKYEILHLMHNLSGTGDKTIIFSTHDFQMAVNQADKIWLILDDKLIEGAPEDLMISGAFEHLFTSSKIIFNSDDGTFSFRNESGESIYLEGEGNKRMWTEKAVNRAGFIVSQNKKLPFITVPSDRDYCWQLTTESSVREFHSIYDLISCLNRETNLPI